MKTYLFTWNPEKWQWRNIQECIAHIEEYGFCEERWSTGVTKRIKPQDRVFLMKLGKQPRGIVASGWVTSEVFQNVHWGDLSKSALYVHVHWDTLIDPSQDALFPIELLLHDRVYSKVHWTPQASGMRIPDDIAEHLESDWARFVGKTKPLWQINYADEVDDGIFSEGIGKLVRVNTYERNREARHICIAKYGATCAVCSFNFEEKFGEIGKGFIHVHHLVPLSSIGDEYRLNPIRDLRPVCPNCHAMLHQRKPVPYTIEELKSILVQRS